MQETESKSRQKDPLESDREAIVDSIAEETGMTGPEDKKMIYNTVERVHLQDKYKGTQLEEIDSLGPSLLESLLNGPNPSHGVAIIQNIREDEAGCIDVYFKIKGSTEEFKRRYAVSNGEQSQIERMFSSNRDKIKKRRQFEKLILVTDSRIDDPTSLIDKKVPVIPNSDGSGYKIHYPNEDSGFLERLKYTFSRFILNKNLVSYDTETERSYEISYTPNRRSWFLGLSGFIASFYLPSIISMPLFIISSLIILAIFSIQFLYMSELE
jgi:hypothetical protein